MKNNIKRKWYHTFALACTYANILALPVLGYNIYKWDKSTKRFKEATIEVKAMSQVFAADGYLLAVKHFLECKDDLKHLPNIYQNTLTNYQETGIIITKYPKEWTAKQMTNQTGQSQEHP
ncbi:hypothetical protein MA9V1_243 [Chryseobacterium phage MA9V-1]|nr:hypothetical protein MA9V1_243 [Chryseobacterium phage MA9V-1]